MLSNEDLLAISQLLDAKLESNLKPINNQLELIDNRLGIVENRLEHIDNRLENVENRLENVEVRLENVEVRLENVEVRLDRVEIDLLENNVIPRLTTIESCYIGTHRRYQDYSDKMESTFEDIAILNKVVTKHSEKLSKIS